MNINHSPEIVSRVDETKVACEAATEPRAPSRPHNRPDHQVDTLLGSVQASWRESRPSSRQALTLSPQDFHAQVVISQTDDR